MEMQLWSPKPFKVLGIGNVPRTLESGLITGINVNLDELIKVVLSPRLGGIFRHVIHPGLGTTVLAHHVDVDFLRLHHSCSLITTGSLDALSKLRAGIAPEERMGTKPRMKVTKLKAPARADLGKRAWFLFNPMMAEIPREKYRDSTHHIITKVVMCNLLDTFIPILAPTLKQHRNPMLDFFIMI